MVVGLENIIMGVDFLRGMESMRFTSKLSNHMVVTQLNLNGFFIKVVNFANFAMRHLYK